MRKIQIDSKLTCIRWVCCNGRAVRYNLVSSVLEYEIKKKILNTKILKETVREIERGRERVRKNYDYFYLILGFIFHFPKTHKHDIWHCICFNFSFQLLLWFICFYLSLKTVFVVFFFFNFLNRRCHHLLGLSLVHCKLFSQPVIVLISCT